MSHLKPTWLTGVNASTHSHICMEVRMYRLICLCIVLGLLTGCGPKKLSPVEAAAEKKAIETLIASFWKANTSKDLPAMIKLYTKSNGLLFFGTDSAEIITSISQWEAQMESDWELIQTIKVGELKNVSVLLAEDGTMGSIMCEMPTDLTAGGQLSHSLFRFASTVQKENGEWKLVHGMVAVATTGQSSAELVAKMKAEAAMPVKRKK